MAIRDVIHYNLIGHEINESLSEHGKSDREIFCKKLHKVVEPMRVDCEKCPYFNGVMQGHGHECIWVDVAETDEYDKVIPHDQAKAEMIRVSKLIDEGLLKKG